jgi:ribose-phosphate pyrophosphokinase
LVLSDYAKDGSLKVFCGSAHPALAHEICHNLEIPLGKLESGCFSDGETKVLIQESVRGDDCFVVQPTSAPVNDNLMELLIIVDALMRASARRISVVIPYFGYARQDRKTRGREPITAKLVANLVATARASRVLTMDLHAGQIQGFFDMPLDHLTGVPILAEYFMEKVLKDPVVVSPDLGGVTRARALADRLGAEIAIIDKRRPAPNLSEVMNVIGPVEGRSAIIIDDIIDTGGTIVAAARSLKARGAHEVYCCCTHGIFSGQAVPNLESAPLTEIVVMNTIPLSPEKRLPKIRVLSCAKIFAEAIGRVHQNLSVSTLFG